MPVAKLLVTGGNPGHSYVLVLEIKLTSTSLTRTVSAAIGIKNSPENVSLRQFMSQTIQRNKQPV